MPAENPLPSSPYTKRVEFAGAFECDGVKTQSFSIEVVYSTVNGHPPMGIVRGTEKEFDALQRFFMARWVSPNCTLQSTSPDRQPIRCTDVHIHGISHQLLPERERETVHQIIGRFSVGELTIEAKGSGKADARRHRTFVLEGPQRFWLTYGIRTLSYTGQIQSRGKASVFSLRAAPNDRLSAASHFFYAEHDRMGGNPRETIQYRRFALTIFDRNRVRRDGTAFSSNAIMLVETLCLLMGFLSKARLDWSSSMYSDGRVFAQTYRDVTNWNGEEPDWEDLIINSADIRRFLNKAFTVYERLTRGQFDIRLPLLHYIASQTSRYVEDRFTVLFFAFEKLLSSLDDKRREPPLLTDKELSALWAEMKPALARLGKKLPQIELIREKRAELQRFPLKTRALRHLGHLRITIDDIGGENGLRSMIKVRNLITHRHGEVPIKQIVLETSRLETIVERMLLKLLGWRGKESTPTYRNRAIRDAPRPSGIVKS